MRTVEGLTRMFGYYHFIKLEYIYNTVFLASTLTYLIRVPHGLMVIAVGF